MTAAASDIALAYLAESPFVSLTTFRRSGEPVATPMWIGRDGDELVCWTPASSAKVKRLRRDPRVRLQRCSRRGALVPGAPVITGTAEIRSAPVEAERALQVLRRTYGRQVDVVSLVERVVRRTPTQRVALRITLDPSTHA